MLEKGSLSQNDLYGCSNSSGDDAKGHGAYAAIFLKRKITMTYQRAILLLSQMYLPQFDEEEKEALTLAIYALEHERYLVQEERKNETQKRN